MSVLVTFYIISIYIVLHKLIHIFVYKLNKLNIKNTIIFITITFSFYAAIAFFISIIFFTTVTFFIFIFLFLIISILFSSFHCILMYIVTF